MLDDGGLARYVERDGIRGVTANPTIFEQAIGAGDDYDEQIADLLRAGRRAATTSSSTSRSQDIRHACDILRPVFDASGGSDGFVSIEVSPDKAFDTQATIDEAKRWWSADRPPEPAREDPGDRTRAAGDRGVPRRRREHQHHADLRDRVLRARDGGVPARRWSGARRRAWTSRASNSVASFFVSRVDTAADKLLEAKIAQRRSDAEREKLRGLLGKVAVANAKIAYGASWTSSAASASRSCRHGREGAASALGEHRHEEPGLQRHPLRAGADRPGHREHDAAADDRCVPRPRRRPAHDRRGLRRGASACCADLADAGISIDEITDTAPERRRRGVLEVLPTRSARRPPRRPSEIKKKVERRVRFALGALRRTRSQRASMRWSAERRRRAHLARDATFWGGDAARQRPVANRLGWLDVASQMRERAAEHRAFARRGADAGFTRCGAARHGRQLAGARSPAPSIGARGGWPRAARARHHRPGDDPRRHERESTRRARCSSSRRSPARRSSRSSLFAYFYDLVRAAKARPRRRELRRRSPMPARRSRRWRGARVSARLHEPAGHRRPLLRAVVLRARARRLSRASTSRGCSIAASRAEEAAREPDSDALRLGAALGELARRGRDKCTFIVVAGDRLVRALGRAAHRREHRQAWDAASCPSPASRSARRRTTATTACSCRSALEGDANRRDRTRRRRAESRRPSRRSIIELDDAYDLGARVLPLGVRRRRRRPRARHQSVRRAKRAGVEGQHEPRAAGVRGAPAGSTLDGIDCDAVVAMIAGRAASQAVARERCRRAAAVSRPRRLLRDHRVHPADGRDRRGLRAPSAPPCATRAASRRRSATARASCTRPGSCTRADRRSGVFLQVTATSDADDLPIPGRAVHVRAAQARAGDRRPRVAARRTAGPSLRVHLGTDDRGWARDAARRGRSARCAAGWTRGGSAWTSGWSGSGAWART